MLPLDQTAHVALQPTRPRSIGDLRLVVPGSCLSLQLPNDINFWLIRLGDPRDTRSHRRGIINHHILHPILDLSELGVQHGAPPCFHPIVAHVPYLSEVVAIVGLPWLQRFSTHELIKVNELGHVHLLVDLVPDLHPVADDPVLVYLAFRILVIQQTKAQLVVVRNKVITTFSRDSEVDIGDLLVVVDEENVLIEENDIDKNDHKLNQEGQEVAHKARACTLFIEVVEELEKVSSIILICKVNDCDQGEVKHREESEPSEGFAEDSWEAEDPFL